MIHLLAKFRPNVHLYPLLYDAQNRWTQVSLSLWLWDRLQNPPTRNPIFRRYLKNKAQRGCLYPFEIMVYGAGMFVLLMSVVFPLATVVIVFVSAVAMMLWHSTLSPLGWITGISAEVLRLRQRSEYDLLSVTPAGRLAVYWGACCSQWDADRIFIDRPLVIRLAIALTLMVLFLSALLLGCGTFFSGFSPISGQQIGDVVFGYVIVLIALAWGYLNYLQSLVSGGLIGMLLAVDSRDTGQARLFGAGFFLLMQSVLYVVGGIFLAYWTTQVNRGQSGVMIGILVAFALLFSLIREVIVRWLWHEVETCLNTELGELACLV